MSGNSFENVLVLDMLAVERLGFGKLVAGIQVCTQLLAEGYTLLHLT